MTATPQRADLNLDEFRDLLNLERARLLNLHHRQENDMGEEIEDVADNELSTGTFDAADNMDVAAVISEREREETQDDNVKQTLGHIERALARMDEGTYGICEATGQPIPIERLRALPWASMTVEAAEQYEL